MKSRLIVLGLVMALSSLLVVFLQDLGQIVPRDVPQTSTRDSFEIRRQLFRLKDFDEVGRLIGHYRISNLAVPLSLRDLSREEIRSMIEGFGSPSERDLRWIVKDSRHQEFLDAITESLGDGISEEAVQEMIGSARLMWFRMDMLNRKQDMGEIDMDVYLLGLREIARMDNDVVASLLNDEQYVKLMGSRKDEVSFNSHYDTVSTEGFSEATSVFTAIRNGEHPEVRSMEDLYGTVPRDVVETVMRASREHSFWQREIQHAYLAGDISEQQLRSWMDIARQEVVVRIEEVLDPEQEMFLYGKSPRLEQQGVHIRR